jgi:hypothetical protein
MKFRIESSLQKLTSKQDFHEDRLSNGCNLITCVNECLSVLPAFIAKFGCN